MRTLRIHRRALAPLIVVAAAIGLGRPEAGGNPDDRNLLERADRLLAEAEDHGEERDARDAEAAKLLLGRLPAVGADAEGWEVAGRLLGRCRMLDDSVRQAAVAAVTAKFAGTAWEPRAHRLAAQLHLRGPHHGELRNGVLHRGDGPVSVGRRDWEQAVAALERARLLYARLAADPAGPAALPAAERAAFAQERIDCLFDLTSAVITSLGDGADDVAVEDDGEDGRWRLWAGMLPRGLPTDAAGNPVFTPMPEEYAPDLPRLGKAKFLLAEIGRLDPGGPRAAQALFRRAMLAMTLYGRHGGDRWDGLFGAWRFRQEDAVLIGLRDEQALTGVADREEVVTLPDDENPLLLLGRLAAEHPADPGPGLGAVTELPAPLPGPGVWRITGRFPGGLVSHDLQISGLAAVVRSFPDRALVWLTDAQTGRPVAGRVELFEAVDPDPEKAAVRTVRSTAAAGNDGLCAIRFGLSGHKVFRLLSARDADGRTVFLTVGDSPEPNRSSAAADALHLYAFADRPAYRPGQTVRFKLWARTARDGRYSAAAAGERIGVVVTGPSRRQVYAGEAVLDAFGGADGSFVLPADAGLGRYDFAFRPPAGAVNDFLAVDNVSFRVEEYRKPEFTVSVEAPADAARLGGPVTATVRVAYHHGAPVAGAVVRCRVYRRPVDRDAPRPVAVSPEWAWLYGGPAPEQLHRRRGWRWEEPRELVTVQRLQTDAAGNAELTLDTAAAARRFPGRDVRYEIEAEAADSARRLVTGVGSVLLTDHPAGAMRVSLEPDRRWCPVGGTVRFRVTAADREGRPQACWVRLFPRLPVPPDADHPDGVLEKILTAEIGPEGRTTVAHTFDRAGLWRVVVRVVGEKDITAETTVRVVGGGPARAERLELRPDAAEYRPGDTARMVVDGPEDARVLVFADAGAGPEAASVVALRGGAGTFELPVTAAHRPNVFVCAVMVRDGRYVERMIELPVPPAEALLNVSLTADAAEVLPGGRATLTVRTTDAAGKPVRAQVALTGYDRSLLQIAPDDSSDPRTWFWNNRGSVPARRFPEFVTDCTLRDGDLPPDTEPPGPWRPTVRGDTPTREWHSWPRPGRFPGDVPPSLERNVWLTGVHPLFLGTYGVGNLFAADDLPQGGRGQGVFTGGAQGGNGVGGGFFGGGGVAPRAPRPGAAMPPTRRNFADTVLWAPAVDTGAEGVARVAVVFPENATAWRFKAVGLTAAVGVGSAETLVRTSKPLVLRLSAPRLLTQGDRSLLTAQIDNRSGRDVTVALRIKPPARGVLAVLSPEEATVKIAAGGQARVELWVRAVAAGTADLEAAAQEVDGDLADAVALRLPVRSGDLERSVPLNLTADPGRPAATAEFTVPAAARPGSARLELRLASGHAAVILDALPYLAGYPYGCTEQTMSRFLPTVVAAAAMRKLGVRAADVRAADKPRDGFVGYEVPAVFDDKELEAMIEAGVARLAALQHADGGWGWWRDDPSGLHMTAHVVDGLLTACEARPGLRERLRTAGISGNRFGGPADLLETGLEALSRQLADAPEHVAATAAYSLVRGGSKHEGELINRLFARRAKLSVRELAVLGLTLHAVGDAERAATVLADLRKLRREDRGAVLFAPDDDRGPSAEAAEAHAAVLRLISAAAPKSPDGPALADLLAAGRKGVIWTHTRATAAAVQALAEHLSAVGGGPGGADAEVTVHLDGREIRALRIPASDGVRSDGRITIPTDRLTAGKHTLSLSVRGGGRLRLAGELRFRIAAEDVPPFRTPLSIERRYYRLTPLPPRAGEGVARYRREAIVSGAEVAVGDLIESELAVSAEGGGGAEYVCFEDPRPAGCEPVQVRSGVRWNWWSPFCNVEIRDGHAAFFATYLWPGQHVFTHRFRAETPGDYRVPPARGFAMYAPDLAGDGPGFRLRIVER